MRRSLSQKTHALNELHELERARLALSAAGAAVYEWTIAEGRMIWGDNAADVLPVARAGDIATRADYAALMHEAEASLFDQILNRDPREDESFALEYRVRGADGSYAWVEDRGVALSNGEKIDRVVGSVRIVTERKARESRLAYLTAYDDLTGHMNRSRLRERLAEALAHARNEGAPCAYFVVAVDGLAGLNEAYGYDVADEVIVAISQRLSGVLRGGDCIGRIAGNKFGVLFASCRETDIPFAAERLRAAARSSAVRTTGGAVAVTVSMGAVAVPSAAETSQEAMLRAEEALDRAKSAGRDSFSIYQASMQIAHARKRNVALGEQILSALSERRLVFAYQPIVSARSGKTVSYECLLRMLMPDGQVAPAGDFIPVAEQLGLVRLVDRCVLEMATDALSRQQNLDLSINVSGLSVGDPAWLSTFDDLARHNGELARRLTVELTETTALHDIADSARFVARLREAGAKVAIDDFGAGYTSFRNLQHLHVDLVKIDGSFVRGLATNRDNQLFVRTLIHLANNFELETVAEWVGEADEVELLKGYGVDYFQGAYFGLPEIRQPWNEA